MYLGAQAGHEVDRVIDRDAKRDGGHDAGAEIQNRARQAHQAKKDQNRKQVGDHGDQPHPDRQEHAGHNHENHRRGQGQALDLTGHDIAGGLGQQHQVAGGADAQLGRKGLGGKGLDPLDQGHDIARLRQGGADQDIGPRKVDVDHPFKTARAEGDDLQHAAQLLGIVPERGLGAGRRSLDNLPLGRDDEVAARAGLGAAVEQLTVIDKGHRLVHAGLGVDIQLQVLDASQRLPAVDAVRFVAVNRHIERHAADQMLVDRVGGQTNGILGPKKRLKV